MSLFSEIFEQPSRLTDLLASQRKNVERISREIQARDVSFVFLAARGTSDNAGRYANYLWSAMNGLPMALATPSLFTYYQQPPKLKNALVVGISQSGQSPDIVSVVQEGRRQGNLTLAITNAPDSPLAQSAEFILDIKAGPELAVAATKTYTTELMAIAMLSAALTGTKQRWDELGQVAGWMDETLKLDRTVQNAVHQYRSIKNCVVLGRGYNYATAFEWALKLKELTYIGAEPYSSADFKHGPEAMVGEGFTVMAIAPEGKVFDSLLDFLVHLKHDLLAELVVISNIDKALSLAQAPFAIPAGIPEWLSPLVAIVPAQLFSHHLTLAKGFDPDKPRTISKVTETH